MTMRCLNTTTREHRIVMRCLCSLIPSRNNPCILNHENHRFSRGARAMHHTPGHDESLLWLEFHDAILKIDQQATINHKEELVIVVVLVPVVFALNHTEAHD